MPNQAAKLPRGDAHDITIEVRNEHGQRVLMARVTMEIDRVAPPPPMAHSG